MKVTLNGDAIRVLNGASLDESRPILTYGLIKDNKIATADGFMLVECPVATESDNTESLLIEPSLVKASRPIYSKKNKEYSCEVVSIEKEVRYKGSYTILGEKPLGTFPSLESLKQEVPKHKHTHYAAFMVGTLKKLLSCCDNDTTIVFRFSEPDNSVIEFISGNIHGLVMPAFTDKLAKDWYK